MDISFSLFFFFVLEGGAKGTDMNKKIIQTLVKDKDIGEIKRWKVNYEYDLQ